MVRNANSFDTTTISNYQKCLIYPNNKEKSIHVAKDKSTSVYFDRENLTFVGLTEAHIKKLQETYKSLDVSVELKKMELWLTSSKGKTRKGSIGFILNWLNNASPQGSVPSTSEQLDLNYCPVLGSVMQEYLRDLWKGREHIFELNMIKRQN